MPKVAVIVLLCVCLFGVGFAGRTGKPSTSMVGPRRPSRPVKQNQSTANASVLTEGSQSDDGSASVSYPTPTSLGAVWDVQCGADGVCSTADPICCGTENAFCIGGGEKCCESKFPNIFTSQIASCGIHQTCCAGGHAQNYDINCCNRTQTCMNGQCMDDPCSNTTDQDFCLTHPSCQWCCTTRQCQSKFTEAYCPMGMTVAEAGGQCFDTCSSYATCDQCVNQSNTQGANNCAWCAQTQSCVGETLMASTCSHNQIARTSVQCVSIGPTGTGLIHVEQTTSQIGPIILGTLLATVMLTILLSLLRYLMYRRRLRQWLEAVEGADVTTTTGGANRRGPTHKKFGFKSSKKEEKNAVSKTAKGDDADQKKKGAEQSSTTESTRELGPIEIAAEEDAVIDLGDGFIRCPCPGCENKVQLPMPKSEAPPMPPPATAEDEEDEEEEDPAGADNEQPKKEEKDGDRSKSHDQSMHSLHDLHEEEHDEEDEVPQASAPDPVSTPVANSPPEATAAPEGETNAAEDRREDEKEEAASTTGATAASSEVASSTAKKEVESTAEGKKSNSNGKPKVDADPYRMVVCLPCYHFMCVTCARKAVMPTVNALPKHGKNTKGSATSKRSSVSSETTQDATSQNRLEHDDREDAEDDHTHPPAPAPSAKCPRCSETLEAVMVPNRIIRN